MALTAEQALDYIYSFTNYEIRPGFRYGPEVINPARAERLLDLLGRPQDDYPTIHVAGTKGKGSVSAICASVLRAAGYRTGLYTSPHLISFNERVQLNGLWIPNEALASLVEEMQPAVAQVEKATTFEVMTALAYLYFSRQKADVAVIEVGMGGKLDATNVIRPLVSVITSLSYDHTHLLGETLTEIATEKAGIIKPGVPVVSASQPEEGLAVLSRVAEERGAPLTLVGRDWWYEPVSTTLEEQQFRAGTVNPGVAAPGELYELPLLGDHQALNATVALATLKLVQPQLAALDDDAIRRGLRAVAWPGRFQVLYRRPLLVLDGAHNGESIARLRDTLERLFPDRRCILIFGVTADKNTREIMETIMPVADEIIVTAAAHPRAAAPADITAQLNELGFRSHQTPNVAAALALAAELARSDDVVFATGSLFVVGDALAAWQEQPWSALA